MLRLAATRAATRYAVGSACAAFGALQNTTCITHACLLAYSIPTHNATTAWVSTSCCIPVLQVHMGPLVATADRPPGDLMSELSALSQAKEIGYDADTQNQALSWRLLRQPEDWDALVDDAYARCDKVTMLCLNLGQVPRCSVWWGVCVYRPLAKCERLRQQA